MNARNLPPAGRRLVVLMFLGLATAAGAAPLDSATITRLQNKATVAEIAGGQITLTHPAAVADVIRTNKFLQTTGDARAELEFVDKSLARVGPNTVFSFDAKSRTLSLEKGDMLFYLPPGAGAVKIKTAALTAALTGTVVIISQDGILVLDGTVTITYKENGKEKTLKLEAGTDHNGAHFVNNKLTAYQSGDDDAQWSEDLLQLLAWAALPEDAEDKIAQFSPWAVEKTVFNQEHGGAFLSASGEGGHTATITRVQPDGQIALFDSFGNFFGTIK